MLPVVLIFGSPITQETEKEQHTVDYVVKLEKKHEN